MATHSSIPAWRIPWTEEPGGLQSMGPHSVGPRVPGPLLIRTRCPDTSPNSILVSVVGSALQMETQLEVKGKNDKELYELEL